MAMVRLTLRGRGVGRSLLMSAEDARSPLTYFFTTSREGVIVHHFVSSYNETRYAFEGIAPTFDYCA